MTNPTPLAVPNGSVLLLYRVRIWCTRHAPLRTTTSCPHGVAFGEHWTPRSPYRRLGTRPISGISTDLRYLARSLGSLRVEDLPRTSTWFPTTGVYHICSTGTTAAVGRGYPSGVVVHHWYRWMDCESCGYRAMVHGLGV